MWSQQDYCRTAHTRPGDVLPLVPQEGREDGELVESPGRLIPMPRLWHPVLALQATCGHMTWISAAEAREIDYEIIYVACRECNAARRIVQSWIIDV
jgi:hypothetical protein